MSIIFIDSLPPGNAARVILEPPPTAKKWRLLRNATGVFADQNAPTLIFEGDERLIIDTTPVNGTAYFYAPFYFDGSVWTAGVSKSLTVNANYDPQINDVVTSMLERLQAGLDVAVSKGLIVPNAKSGRVRALNAPPLMTNEPLPCVSCHLSDESPSEELMGNSPYLDTFDSSVNKWEEFQGGIYTTSLEIISWSLDPESRIALRRALKAILHTNRVVFDWLGMHEVTISFKDQEIMSNESALIFQTIVTFTCMAPSYISTKVAPISDATVDTQVVENAVGETLAYSGCLPATLNVGRE